VESLISIVVIRRISAEQSYRFQLIYNGNMGDDNNLFAVSWGGDWPAVHLEANEREFCHRQNNTQEQGKK
jgi:hypothetical protein